MVVECFKLFSAGTGEEFAMAVKAYADTKDASLCSTVGKVAVNPEQSKHLATAFFRIYGRELEITNLRSEEYAESSRIPIVKVGTPEEDALRRDLTINSLFYNITNCIVIFLIFCCSFNFAHRYRCNFTC